MLTLKGLFLGVEISIYKMKQLSFFIIILRIFLLELAKWYFEWNKDGTAKYNLFL